MDTKWIFISQLLPTNEHMKVLKKLDKFEAHTKDYGILPKILQRLHDNGR